MLCFREKAQFIVILRRKIQPVADKINQAWHDNDNVNLE